MTNPELTPCNARNGRKDKEGIEKLCGEKTLHSPQSHSVIWNIPTDQATAQALEQDMGVIVAPPGVGNLFVLHGGRGVKDRRAELHRLVAIADNEERLVLATGRYIGEGFDDARLDTLFLALPVSWKGTLIQYAGRLHRRHPEKTEVRIYDYVDRDVSMLARMFESNSVINHLQLTGSSS